MYHFSTLEMFVTSRKPFAYRSKGFYCRIHTRLEIDVVLSLLWHVAFSMVWSFGIGHVQGTDYLVFCLLEGNGGLLHI